MEHRPPSPTPFPFIVGSPRSGTTLLRAMLDSHPQLAVPAESYFITELGKMLDAGRATYSPSWLAERVRRHRRFAVWDLPEERLVAALRAEPQPADFAEGVRRIFRAYADHHGKRRYADKTPHYVRHIPYLARLFPEARFIHLIRDGRDVAKAAVDAGFGPTRLLDAATSWRQHVVAGREAGARIGPRRYIELRYEDLVEDPRAELRHLCAFLDLPFSEHMLAYVDRAAALAKQSTRPSEHGSLLQSPTPGMRDWRRDLSRADVASIEHVAGDVLSDLGYERAFPHPSVLRRAQARLALGELAARRRADRMRKRLRRGRSTTVGSGRLV